MSKALPAGRAVLPLLAAAKATVGEWSRYIGTARRDGHDDAWTMGAAITRLRDALAELSTPPHQIEIAPDADPASVGQRARRAFYLARRGETTEVTIGGQRAALIIPAGRVTGAVTPALVLELATTVTGGRTCAVISRDKHGYRVEPATTATAAGRTVVTDQTVLAAWTAGEPATDEDYAAFAAATMADQGKGA